MFRKDNQFRHKDCQAFKVLQRHVIIKALWSMCFDTTTGTIIDSRARAPHKAMLHQWILLESRRQVSFMICQKSAGTRKIVTNRSMGQTWASWRCCPHLPLSPHFYGFRGRGDWFFFARWNSVVTFLVMMQKGQTWVNMGRLILISLVKSFRSMHNNL